MCNLNEQDRSHAKTKAPPDEKPHFEVSNQRGKSTSKMRYIETNQPKGCRLS